MNDSIIAHKLLKQLEAFLGLSFALGTICSRRGCWPFVTREPIKCAWNTLVASCGRGPSLKCFTSARGKVGWPEDTLKKGGPTSR